MKNHPVKDLISNKLISCVTCDSPDQVCVAKGTRGAHTSDTTGQTFRRVHCNGCNIDFNAEMIPLTQALRQCAVKKVQPPRPNRMGKPYRKAVREEDLDSLDASDLLSDDFFPPFPPLTRLTAQTDPPLTAQTDPPPRQPQPQPRQPQPRQPRQSKPRQSRQLKPKSTKSKSPKSPKPKPKLTPKSPKPKSPKPNPQEDLSPYEMGRLNNIARNNAILEQLGLGLGPGLGTKPQTAPRRPTKVQPSDRELRRRPPKGQDGGEEGEKGQKGEEGEDGEEGEEGEEGEDEEGEDEDEDEDVSEWQGSDEEEDDEDEDEDDEDDEDDDVDESPCKRQRPAAPAAPPAAPAAPAAPPAASPVSLCRLLMRENGVFL